MFGRTIITCLLLASVAAGAADEDKIWRYLESDNQVLGIKGVEATAELSDEAALPFLLYAVNVPRPKVAKKAGEALAERVIPEAFDELVVMLDTDDDDIYSAVVTALMAYPSGEYLKEVKPILEDSVPRRRLFAVNYIGEYGGDKKVRLLEDMLSDPDERVKHAAVVALKDEDVDIVPAALELFGSETTRIVADAVAAVAGKRDPRAFERLLELLDHEYANVVMPAAAVLSEYEGDEYIDRYMELSTSESEHLRVFAVRRMGASGDERVIPYILESLDDEKLNVVVVAIGGLALFEYREAADRLKGLLDVDYADEVRFAAMRAVAEMQIEGADVLIADIMKNPSENENLRANAAIALSFFKNDFAFDALYEAAATGDINTPTTASAIRGLGLMGDERALPMLMGLIEDMGLTEDWMNHPVLYGPCIIAISEIGGPDAYDFLYKEYVTKNMQDGGYGSILPFAFATCGNERGTRAVMNDLERAYEDTTIGTEEDRYVAFRRGAVAGLGESGYEEAKEIVAMALEDPQEAVRGEAIKAAGKLFDPDMIPLLQSEELMGGNMKPYVNRAIEMIKERYEVADE
jgi:HEAT repeat protein